MTTTKLREKLKQEINLDSTSMRQLLLPVRNLSALRRAEDEALRGTARDALCGVLRNAAAPSDAKIRFVVLTRGQSDGLKIKPAMVSDQRSQPVAKLQPAGAIVEPIAAAQNLAALEAKAGAAAPTPSRSFEPFVAGSRAQLRKAAEQRVVDKCRAAQARGSMGKARLKKLRREKRQDRLARRAARGRARTTSSSPTKLPKLERAATAPAPSTKVPAPVPSKRAERATPATLVASFSTLAGLYLLFVVHLTAPLKIVAGLASCAFLRAPRVLGAVPCAPTRRHHRISFGRHLFGFWSLLMMSLLATCSRVASGLAVTRGRGATVGARLREVRFPAAAPPGKNDCWHDALLQASIMGGRDDIVEQLQDATDFRKRIGVPEGEAPSCDGNAFVDIGNELELDIVLEHVNGSTRFYGTGTRPEHAVIFVEGDGRLLHATGAVIVSRTYVHDGVEAPTVFTGSRIGAKRKAEAASTQVYLKKADGDLVEWVTVGCVYPNGGELCAENGSDNTVELRFVEGDSSAASLRVNAVYVHGTRRRLGTELSTKKEGDKHYVLASDINLRRTGDYAQYRGNRDEAIKFLCRPEVSLTKLHVTQAEWKWQDGLAHDWDAASAALKGHLRASRSDGSKAKRPSRGSAKREDCSTTAPPEPKKAKKVKMISVKDAKGKKEALVEVEKLLSRDAGELIDLVIKHQKRLFVCDGTTVHEHNFEKDSAEGYDVNQLKRWARDHGLMIPSLDVVDLIRKAPTLQISGGRNVAGVAKRVDEVLRDLIFDRAKAWYDKRESTDSPWARADVFHQIRGDVKSEKYQKCQGAGRALLATILDLCRNAGAWDKPQVKCKEDMGDWGGYYEDDVGVQGSNYTCGMGRDEKRFFNATAEEHKALVATCKSFDDENYCPLENIHMPGQSSIDHVFYLKEEFAKKLAEYPCFDHIAKYLRDGRRVGIAFHCRSGPCHFAAFSDESANARRDADEYGLLFFSEAGQCLFYTKSNATTVGKKRAGMPALDPISEEPVWFEDPKRPEELKARSCYGFTIGVCGGFELKDGTYGARRARLETTWNEAQFRSRAWHGRAYSPVMASFFKPMNAAGIEKVTSWAGTMAGDGSDCSVGGAILALVCGVGGCHDLCRLYNADAFEWYPPALVNELYMETHAIELDYSWELQKLFWAFLDITLEYSGASRESSKQGAFDMRTKRTSGNTLVAAANDRSIDFEGKHDRVIIDANGKIMKVEKDAKPKPPHHVDITLSVAPVNGNAAEAFGPGRTKEAAKRRYRIWKRAKAFINGGDDARKAWRKAFLKEWDSHETSRYKIVAVATCNVEVGKKASVVVTPSSIKGVAGVSSGEGTTRGAKDPETAFTNALAKIIQTQFEINAKHLEANNLTHRGADDWKVEPLNPARRKELRKVLAKIKAELAKLPKVDAPEGTPWAEALAQLEKELAEAKEERVKSVLDDATMAQLVDSIKSRADDMDVDKVESLAEDLAEYFSSVVTRKREAEET